MSQKVYARVLRRISRLHEQSYRCVVLEMAVRRLDVKFRRDKHQKVSLA